jgi:opacity protein-like surface antigen
MKKLLSVFFAVILFAGLLNAQSKMAVGAGVVVSLPIGDFGDANNLGIGGTAAFEVEFIPQLVGTAQAGYITWSAKDEETSQNGFSASASSSVNAVPVMVGAKYYFIPNMGLYGAAQLGLYFMSVDASVETNIPGVGSFDVSGGSSTEFAFKIGGGYEVPVSPTFDVDLSAAFVIISDWTNIEFRLGGKVAL